MRDKSQTKFSKSSQKQFRIDFFPTELQTELQFDSQIPQTNFQKVMTTPQDTAIKQYRHLIQSMCQSYNYEKAILKKIGDYQVPKGLINLKNRKKEQTHNNYVKGIKFANIKKNEQRFINCKFLKSEGAFKESPIKRLAQINEEKKNKLLIDQNPIKIQNQKMISVLNDNKKRQDLFLEALLIQRLQEVQNQKQQQKLKQNRENSTKNKKFRTNKYRRNKTEISMQLPQKLKGVDPKHIRNRSSYKTQADFYRQKHVYNQRTLRFYNYAYKIQKSEKKAKKQQNALIIKTVLQFNDHLGSQGTDKNNRSIFKINKIFLEYSNHEDENPQNLYNYISHQNIQQFFTQYSIDISSRPDIQQFLKQRQNINQFTFMQLLYLIGNINNQENFNLQAYLSSTIFPISSTKQPSPWNKLQKIKKSYAKILRAARFSEMTQHIFKARTSDKKSHSFKLIGFNDFIEILWQLEIFPLKLNKKNGRFIFLYGSSQPHGLNLYDFQNVLLVIGLQSKEVMRQQKKIKWVVQHLNNYFRQDKK